ncbi:MAG TPA: hypothetical protein VL614_22935 [Acetobacteraceae bacterium]|jgi:hypothetical protein|nr:hypothetical protein [Acetobacteraceae bacterium]
MADKVADLVPRSGTDTLTDRRRLGRADYQNPHLIELLRGRGEVPLPPEPEEDPNIAEAEAHPHAPIRGIVLGILIGSSIWMAGGLITWLVL